jgi:hypothetical protein
MTSHLTKFALFLTLAIIQTPAHADEPNNNCAQLAQPTLVRVIYTDVANTEDYTQSITYLKALSGRAMDQHHSVYGLTHATPKLDYEFKAVISSSPDGKVCMVPEVTIKALKDNRILSDFTPVIYGSTKIISHYKKLLELQDFQYTSCKDASEIQSKKINVINVWNEDIELDFESESEQQ